MKIRPFRIAIDEQDVLDLRRRLEQTRWPAQPEGLSWATGMDINFLRSLAKYWLEEFDWRRIESNLNRLPQFEAIAESGSIHFVHLRSTAPQPLPIVLSHGWPSTYAELLTLGEMLANPAKHGASPEDSFDVVIPSLPGYVFSSPPTTPGTNVFTIADHWSALMSTLEYGRFVAHGGDIGAGVSTALGLRHPERVLGLHLNYIPGSYQPHIPQSSGLSAEEDEFFARRTAWLDAEGGYSHVQGTKPDVLAPALNDSPVGLAAWILDKFRSWSDCGGALERRFSHDELLTTICLYWFTHSMPSAMRLYWEGRKQPLHLAAGERIDVPVGIAHFPLEIPIPPRRYVERGYNVTRWTEMRKGGHFAALEEPEALAEDIRAFARQFRSPEALVS
jgi:pimeloyl-ACP methyl ester carboxylesterase